MPRTGVVFAGDITLVGEESHPPYDRPPLSKEVLLSLRQPKDVYYATLEQLAQQRIGLELNTRAREIDRAARTVVLDDAQRLGYDWLVIATGGRPRPIEVAGFEDRQLCYLRTIEDSTSLGALLRRRTPLVVVGGGWIGLEAASAARKAGAAVTMVEAASRLCMRALPQAPADFLLCLHRRQGLGVRLQTTVKRVASEIAFLSDGEEIPCGALVVGIGIFPTPSWPMKRDSRWMTEFRSTATCAHPIRTSLRQATSPVMQLQARSQLEARILE